MTPDMTLSRDIVLVGGGHAHALLLRQWGMDPLPGARLTLINPAPTAPYTGMLPGFVAGHYPREALEIDLVRLARFAGARMIFGTVTGIDRQARQIDLPGRPPIAYDLASIDIGITSAMPELPGFSEYGTAAKPLGPFATRWTRHLEGGGGPVAVIGGGVAGVELALAMRHRMGAAHAVTIVEAEAALSGLSDATAGKLRAELADAGINLIENARVARVDPAEVVLEDGRSLPSALTVGAAGARPFGWLEAIGLDLHEGYIAVTPELRCTNDAHIFAVGDCAHMTETPRPKAGVFAVRAAPVLARNLKAAASDRPLTAFRPQRDFLKLISLGEKRALADRNGQSLGGAWAWRWKDWIDRRFMERLNQPPAMSPAPPRLHAAGADSDRMLCAGCGSKVGPGALDAALARLTGPERADVATGPGDDAAILTMGKTRQVLTTDHLRAFWNDPYIFARIAAVHALGDVWAMGAAPQAVLAQIILPRMTDALQRRTLAEIMQAASEVFTAEGAAIVGGHSTQGAELTLGFTVTGLAESPPITLTGGQPGDRLILTRPIGSGTLLAAGMAGRAQGDDLAAALATMSTPQGDAARLLSSHAHAMTDVTGFGLAGHGSRLAGASGLAAEIDLSAIPLYAGAEALAEEGIRSSIWDANFSAVTYTGPDNARAALLFDPQTSGGLLAAVPETIAEKLAADLIALGHAAAIIGTLTQGAPGQITAS